MQVIRRKEGDFFLLESCLFIQLMSFFCFSLEDDFIYDAIGVGEEYRSKRVVPGHERHTLQTDNDKNSDDTGALHILIISLTTFV